MVLEAGGRPVRNPRDLASAVAEAKPGATVALAVPRDGQRAEQRVTLGEVPGTPTAAAAGRNAGGQAAEKGALGLALAPRPDAARKAGRSNVALLVERNGDRLFVALPLAPPPTAG